MSQEWIAVLLVASLALLFLRSVVIVIAPRSALAKWCRNTFSFADKAKVKPQLNRTWVDIESIEITPKRPVRPVRPARPKAIRRSAPQRVAA